MKRMILFLSLWVSALVIPTTGEAQTKKVPVEQCHQFLEGVAVNCMQSNDINWLWVGTSRGLYIFNSYEGVRTMMSEVNVTALAVEGKNKAWFAIESGEVLSSNRKHRFQVGNGKKVAINSIALIGSQIWIGTRENGIYIHDKNTGQEIAHYDKTDEESGLRSNKINFIHKDSKNTIWIGTAVGVAHVLNNVWKIHKPAETITAVTESGGKIYMMGNKFLWSVSPEGDDWKRVSYNKKLAKGQINAIAVDNQNRLFIASNRFARYDFQTGDSHVYGKKIGFVGDKGLSMGYDKDGAVWVGTATKGMFRIRTEWIEQPVTLDVKNIHFKADSPEFTSSAHRHLDKVVKILKENPEMKIEVQGHTNGWPDEAYCDWLSSGRAQNIAEYLYKKGIPESQVSYQGFGKRRPIASDATIDGRNKNQRVEFVVLK